MYDVYGEEGLRAGLALSTDVRDIRSAWQRFQAKQVQHTSTSTSWVDTIAKAVALSGGVVDKVLVAVNSTPGGVLCSLAKGACNSEEK